MADMGLIKGGSNKWELKAERTSKSPRSKQKRRNREVRRAKPPIL